jgi:hypothetical protein
MMDEHKVEFEKRWQQEVVRLKTEQAVYNDQVMIMSMVSMMRMIVTMMRMIVRIILYDETVKCHQT